MTRLMLLKNLMEPLGYLKSQDISDWCGDIPLPKALRDLYSEVGPISMDLKCSELVTIPKLSKLWEKQEGYRWNAITNERLEDWKNNWIVVADSHDDPFVLDAKTGQVLFCIHGGGPWKFQVLAPSIETAFGALATMALAIQECGDEMWDEEECMYNREALDFRFRKLSEFLGDDQSATSFLNVLEWDI